MCNIEATLHTLLLLLFSTPLNAYSLLTPHIWHTPFKNDLYEEHTLPRRHDLGAYPTHSSDPHNPLAPKCKGKPKALLYYILYVGYTEACVYIVLITHNALHLAIVIMVYQMYTL